MALFLLPAQGHDAVVDVDGLDRERLIRHKVTAQRSVGPERRIVPGICDEAGRIRRGPRRQRDNLVVLVDVGHGEGVIDGDGQVVALVVPSLVVPPQHLHRGCHRYAPDATRKVTPAPPTNWPVPVCVNANWIWSPLTRVQGRAMPTEPVMASVPVPVLPFGTAPLATARFHGTLAAQMNWFVEAARVKMFFAVPPAAENCETMKVVKLVAWPVSAALSVRLISKIFSVVESTPPEAVTTDCGPAYASYVQMAAGPALAAAVLPVNRAIL